MKTKLWLTVVVSLLLAASWVGAEDIAGLPLHMQKLDSGVIRLWLGDHISSTSIMAFATEKGIVVVDTFGIPEVDTRLREVIAREFRRSDFTHLINTHEHRDHTGGLMEMLINSGPKTIYAHPDIWMPKVSKRAGMEARAIGLSIEADALLGRDLNILVDEPRF